jgi:hypothetical protein
MFHNNKAQAATCAVRASLWKGDSTLPITGLRHNKEMWTVYTLDSKYLCNDLVHGLKVIIATCVVC